jgi:hypothetical protein
MNDSTTSWLRAPEASLSGHGLIENRFELIGLREYRHGHGISRESRGVTPTTSSPSTPDPITATLYWNSQSRRRG